VHILRDCIHRLRRGASQRSIARDLGLARMTVQKYAALAGAAGYLDPGRPLPEAAELLARLGPVPTAPRHGSIVEPFRALVEEWAAAGVEAMTIYDRLRDDHNYTGSRGQSYRQRGRRKEESAELPAPETEPELD
jgi:hypothetical protein